MCLQPLQLLEWIPSSRVQEDVDVGELTPAGKEANFERPTTYLLLAEYNVSSLSLSLSLSLIVYILAQSYVSFAYI